MSREQSAAVAIIGLGYIGLPTAVVLADREVRVLGIDLNPQTTAAVNSGVAPFIEPDLREALESVVSRGTLTAHTEYQAAGTYIIAVPTPFNADRSADLSYIRSAAESIAPLLVGGELIILESTSPPGTTEQLAHWIRTARPELEPSVDVAHCPERVLPGRVMTELVENDRIIGGLTAQATQRAARIYAKFCRGELHLTDARTAELAKLVENSYRDVNIAFANELSLVCAELDVDVWRLIELANHHPRVNILQPGPGVGGHCIAVDPWFIVSAAPDSARLIRTAREVNDSKPQFVVDSVVDAIKQTGASTVAALGLAFKRNIDDLRESPAVQVVHGIAAAAPHCTILAVEPHVDRLPADLRAVPGVVQVDLAHALTEADVFVLLVDHDQFQAVDEEALAGRPLVDTRGAVRGIRIGP